MKNNEPKKALECRTRPFLGWLFWGGCLIQSGCVTGPTRLVNRATTVRNHSDVHTGPPIDGKSCLLGYVVAAESTEPIVQASVWLEQEDGNRNISAVLTDDQGFFYIRNLSGGQYRLDVFQRARSHTREHLAIDGGRVMLTTIHLAPQ